MRDEPGRDAAGTEGSDAGGSIADFLRDFRERLRTNGSVAAGDDSVSVEWRVLRQLAREHGRFREYVASDWLNALGGSEHDCRVTEGGRIEKLTRADLAGWRIETDSLSLRPATPLEYFTRLHLTNELFADDIQLVAVEYLADRPSSTRIHTTQRHVPGDAPDRHELVDWLRDAGFDQMPDVRIGAYDAMCFRRAPYWLFDVRPMNFVHTGDEIVPIDVIVQRDEDGDEPIGRP